MLELLLELCYKIQQGITSPTKNFLTRHRDLKKKSIQFNQPTSRVSLHKGFYLPFNLTYCFQYLTER